MLRSRHRHDADTIAIQALGYIAADAEQLDRFLGHTGLGPENLRAAAGEPAFLLSVLEYIAGDERLLLAFASSQSIPPEAVRQAIFSLSGPHPHQD